MSYDRLKESLDSKPEYETLETISRLEQYALQTSREKLVRRIILFMGFLVITLLTSNIITVIILNQPRETKAAEVHEPLRSVDEGWSTYQTVTEYSSHDPAIVEEAWNRFVINGFVALPHAWGSELGWPPARPMPRDPSKGIYVVDGFHQLHCLMSIRSTVTSVINGNPTNNQTHTMRHLNHCFDALRQSIQCRADDTPLYVPKETFWAGDGQQRYCRDWNQLENWVIKHTACYNGVFC